MSETDIFPKSIYYDKDEGKGPCGYLPCADKTPVHDYYIRETGKLRNFQYANGLTYKYPTDTAADAELTNEIYSSCYHNAPKDKQISQWCAKAWTTLKQMKCKAGNMTDRCACMQAAFQNTPEIPADIKAPYLAEMKKLCPDTQIESFSANGDKVPNWALIAALLALFYVASKS